jgi:hypothetical protein
MGINKYHYDLVIVEKRAFLPSDAMKVLKELEDYGYEGFTIRGLSGTVERQDKSYVLVALGSRQKYLLTSTEAVGSLLSEGKSRLTLGGKVTEPRGNGALPSIEVTEVKEAAK